MEKIFDLIMKFVGSHRDLTILLNNKLVGIYFLLLYPQFEDDKFLPVFLGSVGSGIFAVCGVVVELTTGPGPPTHYIILYIAVLYTER